jgi:hypothetical protein
MLQFNLVSRIIVWQAGGGILKLSGTNAVPITIEKTAAKLHLGCARISPDDWINVDGYWNARAAKHPFWRKVLAATSIISKEKLETFWNPTIITRDVRTFVGQAVKCRDFFRDKART